MESHSEYVIAGDSHIFSMGAAQGYAGELGLTSVGVEFSGGYFLMEPWRGSRDASYWQGLVDHIAGRVAVLAVMGNQHFGHYLLAQDPQFDFIDPSEPGHAFEPGAVIVPRRLVKRLAPFDAGWLKDLIAQLRAARCRGVIICGTPPVREDFGEAAQEIRQSTTFKDRAASLGIDIATCRLTPPPVMKRLWGILQEALADAARDTHSLFLAVPDDCRGHSGYLAQQYAGALSDFTHPNHAYGRRMLICIARAVSQGVQTAA